MKRELNFEINILPVLDILSVMICFLLLTAVWVQLGALDVRQAVGDNSAAGGKNPPSVWAALHSDGSVSLSLRDVESSKLPKEMRIARDRKGVNWDRLNAVLRDLKIKIPDLRTGIVLPRGTTAYGDVIRMMDEMRRNQIMDVGLSPSGAEAVL